MFLLLHVALIKACVSFSGYSPVKKVYCSSMCSLVQLEKLVSTVISSSSDGDSHLFRTVGTKWVRQTNRRFVHRIPELGQYSCSGMIRLKRDGVIEA